MNKIHQSPEFTVIKQSQANAKFFVASFGNGGPTGTPPSDAPSNTTNSQASSYGTDSNGGFTF